MNKSELEGCNGASTRSCPKRIAQVVSKFGELKRKLVYDIGFQGMLQVPEINNLDRNFTMSILNKIDIKKCCIRINDETSIHISASDVHQYLHIPLGDKKLFGLEDRSDSEKMDFIRFGIGSSTFDIDEKNSLKAAEEIVNAEYPNGMSEFQVDQFKVSFVCFTMGNFLLAKYSFNHGIKDFWGSLLNPSEIDSFNFCQAVVDEIIECAKHVQRETKANRPVKNISGCHLFLQAMCLNGINMGNPMIQDCTIPKIFFLTNEVLQQMINNLQCNFTRTKSLVGTPITATQKKDQYGRSYFSCDLKGKKTLPIITTPVHTIVKLASTQYLATYTRGGIEKKLNDRQIDDLRSHNARMKLFINTFKAKAFAGIQHSGFAIPTITHILNINVESLMNQVLHQVLILSQNLHEHAQIPRASDFITPSFHTSSKRSSDNFISGIESRYVGSPVKRIKSDNFPTGKNLLPELTNVAATSASSILTPNKCQSGSMPKSASESAFVTPVLNRMKQKCIIDDSAYTPRGLEMLDFSNTMAASASATNVSVSCSNEEKVKSPSSLFQPSVLFPAEQGVELDSANLEDIFEDQDGIDLNQFPVNPDHTYSPIPKIVVKKGCMAKNPWFYADQRYVDKEGVDTLFNWLRVTKSYALDSYWINHPYPKQIKIAGNDFKTVLTKGCNFTEDLFDLAIRRFGQMDRSMYGEAVNLRWLHIFESDFARKVLNDEDYLSSRSIRLQLIGKSAEYDICNCRMIAVPNISNLSWTSYFWDMKKQLVHILDPTFHISNAAEIHEFHNPIVDKLQGALDTCLAAAYDGWEIDWSSWKKNYVQPFLVGKKRHESGLITLLALREFSGSKFQIPQTEVSLKAFAKELLYNMLSLEGNRGVVPDVFIQTIE